MSELTPNNREALTEWAQGFSGLRAVVVPGLHDIVEEIVAERVAQAETVARRRALRDAATALERRSGQFKHLAGDKHTRRAHNDIARWLRERGDLGGDV